MSLLAMPTPDDLKRDRRQPTGQPRPRKSPPDPGGSTGDHEGATEDEVSDRTGPAVGYDKEPEQVRDRGGVL
jgi:hypothetical protein